MNNILVDKDEGTGHVNCLGVEGVGYNIRTYVRHFSCWLRTTSHTACGCIPRSVPFVRGWFWRSVASLPRRGSQPDPSQSLGGFWWIKWLSDVLIILWVLRISPPLLFHQWFLLIFHSPATWYVVRKQFSLLLSHFPFNFIFRTFRACATSTKFGCARCIIKPVLLWERCDSLYLNFSSMDFHEPSYVALCTQALETM